MENMNYYQSKDFIIKAAVLAMGRDGSTGGVIKLFSISSYGIKKEIITPVIKNKKECFFKTSPYRLF
jgi:hypothetical protein